MKDTYFSRLTKNSILLLLSFFCLSFFSSVLLYKTGINKLLIQSEDTIPAIFLPYAILKNGNIYLDPYYGQMLDKYPHPDDKKQELGLVPFYLREAGDHYVSAFPIITPILATPVYLIPLILGIPPTIENLAYLAKASASLIVGLSGLFLYALALRHLTPRKALLLTGIYYFATINLSTLSQALWQHGTVELLTLASFFFLLKNKPSGKELFLSGLLLGFGVLARPTVSLTVLVMALYVSKVHKLYGVRYFLTSLFIPLVFFLVYNHVYYLSLVNQGYSSQLFDSWRTPFLQGFMGLWLSPSKGILIYSPVFIFSLIGFKEALKSDSADPKILFFRLLGAIIILHITVLAFWKHWYGGWSFGYRMASDVLPHLTLLLIPYMTSKYYIKLRKLFIVSIVWSVGIQLMGLIFFDGIWHAAYDKGFRDQTWLWSLRNSEVGFNIRRIMVKLGFLDSPLP